MPWGTTRASPARATRTGVLTAESTAVMAVTAPVFHLIGAASDPFSAHQARKLSLRPTRPR